MGERLMHYDVSNVSDKNQCIQSIRIPAEGNTILLQNEFKNQSLKKNNNNKMTIKKHPGIFST